MKHETRRRGIRKSVGGIDGIRARPRVAMQLLQNKLRLNVHGDDFTVLGSMLELKNNVGP